MPVQVKVDEDLPGEIARLCEAVGYPASTVYGQGHSGMPDDQLWPLVQQEKRVLFTADKGFADARVHPPGSHEGIVLFRLPRESRSGYLRYRVLLRANQGRRCRSGDRRSIARRNPRFARVMLDEVAW